jgi:hypothetical protein
LLERREGNCDSVLGKMTMTEPARQLSEEEVEETRVASQMLKLVS